MKKQSKIDPRLLTEKALSSELAFNGNFLKIYRDQVELPNGHKSFREYIKHPGAAMVIPMVSKDRVLMIHQYRHAVKKIFLEFPAGKCDAGESTEMTALRELQEETGLKADKVQFLTRIHPVIGYSNEHIDLFVAENLKSVPRQPDPDELLEFEEFAISDLQKMIWNQEITDVKTQIGIFWLLQWVESKIDS